MFKVLESNDYGKSTCNHFGVTQYTKYWNVSMSDSGFKNSINQNST